MKYDGELGNFVNNTGIFQGSPLSAQLFIIYADYAMAIYSKDIHNAKIQINPSLIRGDKIENKWAKYILNDKNKIHLDKKHPLGIWKLKNSEITKLNYLNFADGANIDITEIKDIPRIFYSFAYAYDEVNSLINWGKKHYFK